jgi:hypothetical protein
VRTQPPCERAAALLLIALGLRSHADVLCRYLDIVNVSKKTTLGLFQNAIEISTSEQVTITPYPLPTCQITQQQGRIFLTSFLSRDEAFSGIVSRMKLLGNAMETLSPPALDTQTAMLLDSSDARKGIVRGGGANHRRSLSLSGSIDVSIQNDAVDAVAGADADVEPAVATGQLAAALSVGHSMRELAESGSSVAEAAVEAAVNYVAATSPFAPLLARCEALLLVASCNDMQQPPVPQNHVSPLVDYQLPVSVQEFFLCFISDDHQFNTKVTPLTQYLCFRAISLRMFSITLLWTTTVFAVPRGRPQTAILTAGSPPVSSGSKNLSLVLEGVRAVPCCQF